MMSSPDMFWQLNIGLVNTLYNVPRSTWTVQYNPPNVWGMDYIGVLSTSFSRT